ncbi:transmembrane protein, putative (macronuclear) [Tetrahymena thermophila SB210]|uniref:Transmembrane protein, putative n=1 Tax=Tetrahymena thermophila (strain SB210) TaxID=312017 RepID=Q22A23_TETTS|nr:transmembrane protein, putative [Tetrahymena thermophila SB210]EAR82156.1 transmembrane protein, putative [Tetrahymena thermophila SB210]|eukprot:XP_001029820.1 transmembrane protein, putative [Tetrahymena thermophila SB210]
MEKGSKFLILGSIGLGILGGLYMLFGKNKVRVKLSRDQVVLFLKDLKSQSQSQFITTAKVIQRMISETGGQYKNEVENTAAGYIRSEVQEIFDQKKEAILIKYQIDEQDLAQALESDFKNDDEINKILNEIHEGFENSLKGIEPPMNVKPEVFEILTKDKTYDIVKKIMKLSTKLYLKVFTDLKKEGEKQINLKNPKFLRKIGQLNMRDRKNKLILDEGVNLEPDSPTDILGKVTQKYKDQDIEFAEKLIEVDRQFTYVIEKLGDEITTEEQIDKAFQ